MRVLIVEDELRLAANVAESLRQMCGFAVDVAPTGTEGLFMATNNPYDGIVLDLMLPGMTGYVLLETFRQQGFRTPVLVLTASDDKALTVALLNAGADDYLAKPFDLGELIARIKALMRRSHGHASATLILGCLEIDTIRVIVRCDGREVVLAPMEFRVLEYLMLHIGVVVSKTELLEHLYDYNWEKFSNVIEVYVAGLRRKLEGNGCSRLIQTIRGHGYVIREGDAK